VVSIGGLAVEEYWKVAEELAEIPCAAFEINVSCPNLEHGGLEIGAEPAQVDAVVRGVVERTERPVIVKLTPNVTRIEEIAIASQEAGAAAITVANTFVGLTVDVDSRTPTLGNGTGGVSGPAIKPLALRLVRQASLAVSIPVIGCGGITSTRDAVEFLIAGATAVQVGTANFTLPDSMIRIIDELPGMLDRLGAKSVRELVGTLVGDVEPAALAAADAQVRGSSPDRPPREALHGGTR
jgi:dihydroorotate dehydrogenase (NAD+) catalytic subunit